jgi:antitoxin HicB
MNIQYPFIIKPQKPKGYLVECVDIKEAFTEGDTIEECLRNASEVLTLILDYRLEKGLQIPKPSKAKSAHYVAPDAKTQAAILILIARGDRPMSEIARAMKTSCPSTKRMENPKHWPSLRQLDKIATAMGKKLVISFEENNLK